MTEPLGPSRITVEPAAEWILPGVTTIHSLPHASPGCACGINDAGEYFIDPICDTYRARLGIADCTCRYEYKGLGILYGVSMGKGWVRMNDDPKCQLHAAEATKETTP